MILMGCWLAGWLTSCGGHSRSDSCRRLCGRKQGQGLHLVTNWGGRKEGPCVPSGPSRGAGCWLCAVFAGFRLTAARWTWYKLEVTLLFLFSLSSSETPVAPDWGRFCLWLLLASQQMVLGNLLCACFSEAACQMTVRSTSAPWTWWGPLQV